jgi:hypothetical protein
MERISGVEVFPLAIIVLTRISGQSSEQSGVEVTQGDNSSFSEHLGGNSPTRQPLKLWSPGPDDSGSALKIVEMIQAEHWR